MFMFLGTRRITQQRVFKRFIFQWDGWDYTAPAKKHNKKWEDVNLVSNIINVEEHIQVDYTMFSH